MTTKQLLSSNSYIQYPKFLGYYLGVNEAILLSALCDKDSWCEFNTEQYDGWFYYLRDEIYLETGLSERQQRTALANLEEKFIVSIKRCGIPAKVYYFINTNVLEDELHNAYNSYKAHKTQMLQNVTSCPNKNVTTCTSENVISSIDNNKNIKINNKSTGAGALAKHPRNFSKQTLTDELESGKDIDEQKKEKKKISEYDKCYKEIDDRYTDKNINSLLHQHLDWSYHSKDPQRLRNLKVFKKRLDELDRLDNKEEVVKQSLQKQWHCFYELTEKKSGTRSTKDNSTIVISTLSEKEKKQIIAERIERNGII